LSHTNWFAVLVHTGLVAAGHNFRGSLRQKNLITQ